ncbi:MAG: glycoside hydrolase, partial [Oscillospiraceae bacterium]|nr:glycoside hydrolase [Oscillospiraceae bacterium]
MTFDDCDALINANGNIEIPITDPEHLKQIILTADVTSSAGSAWGGAGCALCTNVETLDGTQFWTSKSYSISLGSNQTASVEFDGTFTNDEEVLEAVIYDGKIEVQQWYAYSEQGDLGLEDTLTVNYTNIQVIYETVTDSVRGDVNSDGKF